MKHFEKHIDDDWAWKSDQPNVVQCYVCLNIGHFEHPKNDQYFCVNEGNSVDRWQEYHSLKKLFVLYFHSVLFNKNVYIVFVGFGTGSFMSFSFHFSQDSVFPFFILVVPFMLLENKCVIAIQLYIRTSMNICIRFTNIHRMLLQNIFNGTSIHSVHIFGL